MLEKVIRFLLIIFFVFALTGLALADGEQKPSSASKNGNFQKSNFSNKNAWSKNSKALAPPNPNGGGGGNRIPISSGITFLLIGSTLYFLKKLHDENV